jgi:putative hydrolase of the HAD superfamily
VIKAIIFDIGNVLLHFDYNRAFEDLGANSSQITPELICSLEPLNCDLEAGRIGRSEFVRRVGEAIGFRGTEEEFVAAWQPIFTENHVMHELVARLRERFPLYLLSNVGEIHCEYVLRTYPVFGAFADGVYSYRAGCLKPALEIYQIAARQFGVNPAETLYLDDMPANVEGAKEAGFQAVLYRHTEHEAFLGELERLGVL